MKKTSWVIIGVITILAASCASTGNGGDGLRLAEAIEQSAEKIAADLPVGSIAAIAAFESADDDLSEYIMGELTGALFARGIIVVERSLEHVYRELNLQMSGEVSDESAQSIGHLLGAEIVITGQLTDMGNTWRYRVNAIHVESGAYVGNILLDVAGGPEMRRLLAARKERQRQAAAAEKRRQKEFAATEKQRQAEAFLDRGISFLNREDYDTAIEDFTEAIRLDPKLSEAYFQRGYAYDEKGDYDRAIVDYTQAIRIDPNDAMAYNNRGNAYSYKGDYDRAIADYTQAIRIDPNDAIAYYNRGHNYIDKGDYDRAIADNTQAIRLDPNYASAYYNRGVTYSYKGDYDRAIADYEAALRIDLNDANARNNLEVVRQARGY